MNSSHVRTCLLVASLLLPTTGAATPSQERVERFYGRILGDWVGESVARVQGQDTATTYFHLSVTRAEPGVFHETFTFYRRDSRTGALQPSGTQTNRATLEASGRVRCEAEATGTILIDFKPKKQTWKTTGAGRCEGDDRFCADVSGRISVEGMPLGVGKRGRIRSARASWTLQGEILRGRTEVESRFRAFLVSKSYRVVTEMRAERGRDVPAFIARARRASGR